MNIRRIENLSFCTQVLPPESFANKAAVIPRGNRDIQRLAFMGYYLWPKEELLDGLRVRFLGGSFTLQEKVKQYATLWSHYAGISFNFVLGGDAHIIVSFNPNGGHWSVIGTQSKYAAMLNQPSMNLAITEDLPENIYSSVIIHEFGHALGCVHEHQSPVANIPWDKPAVYAYYAATFGWPQQQVDANILNPYSSDNTTSSEFDAQSIMLYHIPPELTNGVPMAAGWNTELSPNDKEFIARAYPAEGDINIYRTYNFPNAVSDGAKNAKIIYFSETQPVAPLIVVGLKMLAMLNTAVNRTICAKAYADDISQERFTVHLDSWGDTRLYNGEVMWMKLPRDLGFQQGACDVVQRSRAEAKQRVNFPVAFIVPPQVFACISGFEISHDWQLSVLPTNIDTTGFDLDVTTGRNTDFVSGRADWVAFPAETAGVTMGTFNTDTSTGLNGHVDFGNAFSRPPQVFVALNQFSITNRIIDFRVAFGLVERTGMEWRIQAADDTGYAVGCAYIALADNSEDN